MIFKILILFIPLFSYIICLEDQYSLDLHNIKGNSDYSESELGYIDEFIIPVDTNIIEYNYNYPLINVKAKTGLNIKDYELNTSKVEITNHSLLGNFTYIEYKMKLDKNGQLIFDKVIHNGNNNIHLINDNMEKIISDRKELDKRSILDISELYTSSNIVKDIIPENLLCEILSNCTDIEFFEVLSLMNNESFYKEENIPFREKKMNKHSRQGENSSIVDRNLEFNVPINESKNSTVDFTIEDNMLIFDNSTENIENMVIEQNTDIDILENRQIKPDNLNRINDLFLLGAVTEEEEAYYKNFLEPVIKEVPKFADISYKDTLIVVLVYNAIKPTIPKMTISTVINKLITDDKKLTGKNWIRQCPIKIKDLYRSAKVVATTNIQLICDDLLRRLIILSRRYN